MRDAGRQFIWATMAGFFMTGLLPFVERLFGVLTDLSLLELGDITHPVLQELVRRAPSTYNHSITVGSIAEAAADAIGARGLLCRVGAYFHDIGKMLKPGYFVENQGKEGSRHEGLVPAMSTLVIIAHIKDGADLARQHHLPQPIIDMIQQHHGTMLMEYFYDRAHTQQAADPNGSEIDENLFRYPGPKPQTKEAAVLMLADAVESASRTLVDPTPGADRGPRPRPGPAALAGRTVRRKRPHAPRIGRHRAESCHVGGLDLPWTAEIPRSTLRMKQPSDAIEITIEIANEQSASALGPATAAQGRAEGASRRGPAQGPHQRGRGRRRDDRPAQLAVSPPPRPGRRVEFRARPERRPGGRSGRRRRDGLADCAAIWLAAARRVAAVRRSTARCTWWATTTPARPCGPKCRSGKPPYWRNLE